MRVMVTSRAERRTESPAGRKTLTPGGGELTVGRNLCSPHRAKSAIFRGAWLAWTLMCHANMKLKTSLLAAAVAATVGLTAPAAHAADGPLLGFSVDGYVA